MKHLETEPYIEDPDRENERPIGDREVIADIESMLTRGEGYWVRIGKKVYIKDKKGETRYFCDETELEKMKSEHSQLAILFERAQEKSDLRLAEPQEADDFVSDTAQTIQKEKGY